jgi:RNA 2',3'-cyclic 3'-phosphodiesterase
MRLFIAIPLGGSVEAELKRLTSRLRPASPLLRWSAPEAWHITLQFLGNTTQEQYDCLLPRLSGLKSAPFSIGFEGLGVFDRAGVFFLSVVPAPALSALQKKVAAATHLCGFESENRPYHPHITLARTKSGNRAAGNQNRELRTLLDLAGPSQRFETIRAEEFLLYESHLSSSGSKYEVRARFPLES